MNFSLKIGDNIAKVQGDHIYLGLPDETVGEIDTATLICQPALSQQLAELRRNELVKTWRAAKQIWYDLADEKVGACVRAMEAILGDESDVQQLLTSALHRGTATKPATPIEGDAGFARIV